MLMMFVSGCVRETANNSYCDIAEILPYSDKELDKWTIEHLRAVDNHNERYLTICP